MDGRPGIRIGFVKSWQKESIVELYRAGGWWKEHMDPSRLEVPIRDSYFFVVAVDTSTGRSVGMGRVISDVIADAYVQDVAVLTKGRKRGVGRMIVSALLEDCRSRGIALIGLIAQPGTDGFYRSMGFVPLQGHLPMLFQGAREDVGSL